MPDQVIERSAFTYTPGDGLRFTWNGDTYIIVERLFEVDGERRYAPTGDRIEPPAVRTGTALMATVDAWRAAR